MFEVPPFQYHKVWRPNILYYTTSWNEYRKFALKNDSYFIIFFDKSLVKTNGNKKS